MAEPSPIGVLLPARLETVFVEPAAAGEPWKLQVLVIPDEPWMDRHNPRVSRHEMARLEAMWRACEGNLDTGDARGPEAFRWFVGEVGEGRAAWLARTFPPLPGIVDWNAEHVVDWDAVEPRLRAEGEGPRTSRLWGLPPVIEIWLGRAHPGDLDRVALDLQRLEPPLILNPDALDLEAALREHGRLFWRNPDGQPRSWFREAGLEGLVELPFSEEAELDLIEFIAAVGLGDSDPVALFGSHASAGLLSILKPGMPTNTIAGAPAADLGKDPDAWRRLVSRGSTEPATAGDLAQALGGDPGPITGGSDLHRQLNETLVKATWPALWGHAFRDIWNVQDGPDPERLPAQLGVWAADHLHPEGPLPPIRIGDQPYGILPVASLQPASSDPGLEVMLKGWLRPLRDRWAAAPARPPLPGNVVDADTDGLLDLISRTPSPSSFGYRLFLPLQMIYTLSHALHEHADLVALRDLWESTTGEQIRTMLPADPRRRYATWGWPQALRIPLVEPAPGADPFEDWLRWVEEICHIPDLGIPDLARRRDDRRPYLPNSLLLRLLIHSLISAGASVFRFPAGGPMLEPFLHFLDEPNEMLHWLHDPENILHERPLSCELALTDDAWDAERLRAPEMGLLRNTIESISALGELYRRFGAADTERAFRAVLETASHRIDPWITGLAWGRLNRLRDAGARSALGLYAWVDRPYRGQPGPLEGGLLHAPSDSQARAAVILRDKAVNDPQPDRWQMNVTSRSARLARQLADEVRAGAHIQEVLGRRVEAVVGRRDRIQALRTQFPIRTEHAGRRTCDGQKVLALDEAELGPLVDGDEKKLGKLLALKAAVDTYADLLVANAVFDIVQRRPEKAGETMDAAAGLGLPPDFEVLSTPRRGRAVNTTVLIALRNALAPNPDDPEVSPAALVEPAFASLLAERLPPARWFWRVKRPGNQAAIKVTLASLGLTPVDTLALPEDTLRRLVVEQADGGTLVEKGQASPGLRLHAAAKRLAATFAGQALPARQAGAPTASVPAQPEPQGEPADAYARLHHAALRLSQELGAAVDPAAADAAQAAALRRAARWGIAPAPLEPDPPVDAGALPPTEEERRRLMRLGQLAHAHETLAARLAQAPLPPGSAVVAEALAQELAMPAPDPVILDGLRLDAQSQLGVSLEPLPGEDTISAARRAVEALGQRGAVERLSADEVGRAMVALATGGPLLPVLSRVRRSALNRLGDNPSPLRLRRALDREWLTLVAAVRPALARLESFQLAPPGKGGPLQAWSNRAGWSVEPQPLSGMASTTQLRIVYAPRGVLAAAQPDDNLLAVVTLDAWTETVPDVRHATTAAFAFNAPGARAPQAILLAAPPDDDRPLDAEAIAALIAETRLLAHARMATLQDLSAQAGALPLASWLPAADPGGVPLDVREE